MSKIGSHISFEYFKHKLGASQTSSMVDFDAPLNSLIDSTTSPKVKTTNG
jgi:hypothetical protein